jgi:RsiW-degrading membrane proteinase PrsW (M82 family)
MTTFIVILAALAPALGLLYFIYNKDVLQKEPRREVLIAFGYGAISVAASTLVSLPLMGIGVVPSEAATVGEHIRVAVFGAGIPEELAKFVLLWLFIRRCRYFDEYVDGIVYAACVGLGFAAVENIMYLIQNFDAWAYVGAMRALFSVPGHFFFAVVMGYYVSKACFDDPSQRLRNFILALVVPMLLHSAFDALLMVSTLSAAATGLIALFIGLYIFMAKTSKKMYNKHLETDREIRNEIEEESKRLDF